MKKVKNFIKFATVFLVMLGIVWSTFAYNNRPMPFEDVPAQANPVEEIAKGAADKVNETAHGVDLGKIWEDTKAKANEIIEAADADKAAPVDSGVPTTVDLAAVKIASPNKQGYDRALFGKAWDDVDGNFCDTRNDILARDLKNVVRTDNCTVASGTLEDRYTASTIEFVRGKSKVDIDHVIPLSYAFRQGASDWTADKRKALANDPDNLAAASASANRSKSDSGPADWMPKNNAYHCEYGKKFAAVAVKYDLPITQADFNTIQSACK